MPTALLQPFLDAFTNELRAQPAQDLLQIWNGKTQRTAFYTRTLGQVATALGLTLKPEHCLIDVVLGEPVTVPGIGPAGIVPLIALESENQVDDAWKEIDHLCALNAPLKVLVTCAIWSRASKRTAPDRQALRTDLLARWRAIHAAHVQAHPGRAEDVLLVVVGERTGSTLRFFTAMVSGPHPAVDAGPGEPFLVVELPERG